MVDDVHYATKSMTIYDAHMDIFLYIHIHVYLCPHVYIWTDGDIQRDGQIDRSAERHGAPAM